MVIEILILFLGKQQFKWWYVLVRVGEIYKDSLVRACFHVMLNPYTTLTMVYIIVARRAYCCY